MAGMVNGAKAYQAQVHVDMAQMVDTYAPLVKRIALHLKARLPASVELDDLIQSGMIGLMDAITHFEDVYAFVASHHLESGHSVFGPDSLKHFFDFGIYLLVILL